MDRYSGSGQGLLARLPIPGGDSGIVGFRSLHGCGAAGDFHPSSSHPSVYDIIKNKSIREELFPVKNKLPAVNMAPGVSGYINARLSAMASPLRVGRI